MSQSYIFHYLLQKWTLWQRFSSIFIAKRHSWKKIDLLIKTRKKSYIEPSESLLNLLNEKVLAYFLAINSSLEDNPEDIEYTDLYLLSIKKKFNNAEYYSVSYPDHNRRMLKLTIDRTKLKKRKS